MARPKSVKKSVSKNLCLPEELVCRVDLELYSPLEGRVPMGAWKAFISKLLREHFERIDAGRGAQNGQ